LFVEKASAKAAAGRNRGELQQLYFVDPQSRLVRVMRQERAGDRWVTTILNTCAYDDPLDAALFQPHFGKDLQVVEAGAEAARPGAKPAGAVLVYQVDPKSVPVGTTVDMDRLLRMVNLRLNGGQEPLAAVRKPDDRRIEVTLVRRDERDRQRIERQLASPGTLEFRVLANRHVDKALIDRAEKEPAKEAVLDPSGKRLVWWVPVKPGVERSLRYPDIAKRTRQVGDRKVTEALVVADPCNVTGAYLTRARLEFTNWGKPTIGFRFNKAGGKLLAKLTGDHLPNPSTDVTYKLGVIVDGELFSAPALQSTIGDRGEITGEFTEIEASDLAALLSAGSLPVRLQLVEERPHP
jgi:preprotein translocase subunit SecD